MLWGRRLPPDEEPDDFDDLDDDTDAEDESSDADDEDDDDDDDDDGDGAEDDDELPATTVFVATATPLEVSVAPLPDERAPDGVCLLPGSTGGSLRVARCQASRSSVSLR